MIPKEIIEKAIEGGWKPRWDMSHGEWTPSTLAKNLWTQIALDQTFWQALGKSCGWYCLHCGGSGVAPNRDKCFGCGGKGTTSDRWRKNALIFYDLILTNQPTDTFWQEIINANK